MNHKYYKELLTLSVYEELSDTEAADLANHIRDCASCRTEFDEIKKLSVLTKESLSVEVPETTMSESRQELLAQVRNINRKNRNTGVIEQILHFPYFGKWQTAFSLAVVCVVTTTIYFFFIQNRNADNPPLTKQLQAVFSDPANESSESTPSNTVDRSSEQGTGESQVMPVSMDPNIDISKQKAMAHSLTSNENPGVRLRALNNISAKKSSGSKVIKQALIKALQYDSNPGVRKEAMKTLAKISSDEDVQNALLYVLQNDKNSGLRIMAINYLDSMNNIEQLSKPKAVDALRERTTQDNNSYVKIRAKSILKRIKV